MDDEKLTNTEEQKDIPEADNTVDKKKEGVKKFKNKVTGLSKKKKIIAIVVIIVIIAAAVKSCGLGEKTAENTSTYTFDTAIR